jgi:hypothetical protein
MPVLPEDELIAESLTEIEAHIAELMSADLTIENHQSSLAWDPILRRHVHTHSARIWRRFDGVTIEVSSFGEVISFRDENRLLINGPARPLSDARLMQIIATTGHIGKSATFSRVGGHVGPLLTVHVRQHEPDHPSNLRVTINTVHELVAAFETMQGDP